MIYVVREKGRFGIYWIVLVTGKRTHVSGFRAVGQSRGGAGSYNYNCCKGELFGKKEPGGLVWDDLMAALSLGSGWAKGLWSKRLRQGTGGTFTSGIGSPGARSLGIKQRKGILANDV